MKKGEEYKGNNCLFLFFLDFCARCRKCFVLLHFVYEDITPVQSGT